MGSMVSLCFNTAVNHMAFPAPRPSYSENDVYLLPYHKTTECDKGLSASTEECGTIAVLFLMHTDDHVLSTNNINKMQLSTAHNTIIYSHGNAVDLGDSLQYGTYLALATGNNVVLWDYASYGMSTMPRGRANNMESNLYQGIQTVYKSVRENVPHHGIYLMGKSLGTVPTVWLARSLDVKKACDGQEHGLLGMVLVSPLASGVRTLCDMSYFPDTAAHFMDSMFADSVDRIADITVPILIMHGKQDTMVPYENSRQLLYRLHNHHRHSNYVFHAFEHAGHNDIEERYPEKFEAILCKFMQDTANDADDA